MTTLAMFFVLLIVLYGLWGSFRRAQKERYTEAIWFLLWMFILATATERLILWKP